MPNQPRHSVKAMRRSYAGRGVSPAAERLGEYSVITSISARQAGSPSTRDPERKLRSATLLGYREAALSVGIRPDEMLASVDLDAECMTDLNTRIPFDAFLALLAQSAAKAGCGDFGVRAALTRGLPDYGPVSLALREAETVEDALELYTRYLRLHADDTIVRLDRRHESPFIKLDIHGNTSDEIAQVTQFGMVGLITQLTWLLGGSFRPDLVCFAFPRPPSVFPRVKFVDCDVVFDQTVSGIVIDRDVLARPLVTSDPRLRRIAMQQLGPILQDPPHRFAGKVHQTVKQLLAEGRCTSENVAARFQIDRRTLNRRLEREGETFSSIVQKIRVDVTLRSIADTQRSLTEIADLAGFEGLSSFSRWFQKTFGCNARDWRRGKRLPAEQMSLR